MDIDVFPSKELPVVFRALRSALCGADSVGSRERLFLETYARITGYPLTACDPQPIAPCEVRVDGAHQRKRLIQLCGIAVLLSRPLRPASIAFLQELSSHLATHDGVINVIDAVAKGRRLRARMLAMRRGMRAMIKEAYLLEGAKGVLRMFGAMLLKAPVNRDKLLQYKRLGLLPEGTLGREYWKHMTRVGFGFPGDIGGIPHSIAYHDVTHVLAEHPATGLGEIQQGSFQGGNRREDGFFFIQFVLLHFHQGVPVTPGAPTEVDNFKPDLVLWAIHRGAKCNVDVTHQWDFWPLMTLTLDEARRQCGLLPRLPADHLR